MSRRKPNFNTKELETILDCLESRLELVTPDFKIPHDVKLKLWNEIADQVNLFGGEVDRTATEVKKKYSDFKSRVKIKADEVRKGKLDKETTFSHLEQQVLQLVEKAESQAKTNGSVYIHSFVNVTNHNDPVVCKEEINELDDDAATNLSNAIIERIQSSNSLQDFIDYEEQEGSNTEKAPEKKKIEKISSKLNLPSILKMPGITVLQEIPSEMVEENSQLSQKGNKTEMGDSHVSDMMDMLWESQKELKKELKEIKRIMFRMSQQKRKRLQQENEKIQLKKMKLYLKCKKMGVDYEDFISECL